MLQFLAGKPVLVKDVFRLGKYAQNSHHHPCPVLIKLTTPWNRRLILLRKSNYAVPRLFVREDVAPEHKLCQRKPKEVLNLNLPTPTHVSLLTLIPVLKSVCPYHMHFPCLVGNLPPLLKHLPLLLLILALSLQWSLTPLLLLSPCSMFVSVSGMDDSFLSGRPFGVCSILYRKSLLSSVTPLQTYSDRFCVTKLCDSSGSTFLVLSVYLPAEYPIKYTWGN